MYMGHELNCYNRNLEKHHKAEAAGGMSGSLNQSLQRILINSSRPLATPIVYGKP